MGPLGKPEVCGHVTPPPHGVPQRGILGDFYRILRAVGLGHDARPERTSTRGEGPLGDLQAERREPRGSGPLPNCSTCYYKKDVWALAKRVRSLLLVPCLSLDQLKELGPLPWCVLPRSAVAISLSLSISQFPSLSTSEA